MTTDSDTNAAEKPMSIRECLDAVHKAGGNAWDKVADPDGFIRWMRGSDDPKDVAAADQAMQSMPAQSPASAPEQASVGAEAIEKLPRYTVGYWSLKDDPQGNLLRRDQVLAALSPRPPDVQEQQDKSWQCPKCKRWQMHTWNICRSEFDTGIPCDGVREQPSYTAAGAMTPDQLREWKQQQAEQGDGGVGEALQLLEQNGRKDLAKMVRDALAALAAAAKGQGTVTT
jgi:hypothetical protein